MKLRLSPGGIRFRVSKAELENLLSGRAISLEVVLPRDHVYRANVRPSVLGKWQLDTDPTGLWLTIPAGELQDLSEALPSREGLQHRFDLTMGAPLEVSFQVDVKDRSSRAATAAMNSSATSGESPATN
jgi:hypothetical protein